MMIERTVPAQELVVGQWIYSPWPDDTNPWGLYEVVQADRSTFTLRSFNSDSLKVIPMGHFLRLRLA